MHVCKQHAACTRARNLPDKWGEPQNSPVLDHNEKVRHENSKSISKSSDPPFLNFYLPQGELTFLAYVFAVAGL